MPQYKVIPIEQLIEPKEPVRFAMDDAKLAELAESIKKQGVLQNLGVILAGCAEGGAGEGRSESRLGSAGPSAPLKGRGGTDAREGSGGPEPSTAPLYEIVFGHRRYKASVMCELKELPCMVFEDKAIARHAAMLDENLCREDITAAEEAVKYTEIIESYDCTEDALQDIVKRPLSYIYARLDLMKGNKAVFEAVAARHINLSVAQQLNRVDDDQHCRYLLQMCVDGGASARTVMAWVQDYKTNGPGQVVNLQPIVDAAKAAAHPEGGPVCFFCNSNKYPANIVWVPIHDFERDGLIAKVQEAASAPDLSQATEATP
jgi:ParB/RepB/Spo0J family partition protein